jgi:hypothetical protein
VVWCTYMLASNVMHCISGCVLPLLLWFAFWTQLRCMECLQLLKGWFTTITSPMPTILQSNTWDAVT